MSFSFKAKVTGINEAVASLSALKRGFRNRVLRKSLRAGSRPLIVLARSFVNVRSGTYKKALGVVIKNAGPAVVARIAARPGTSATVDGREEVPARIAHLEEEGRGPVEIKSAKVLSDGSKFYGQKVAAAKGSHAFRKAYDQGQATAVGLIEQTIAEELAKFKG